MEKIRRMIRKSIFCPMPTKFEIKKELLKLKDYIEFNKDSLGTGR